MISACDIDQILEGVSDGATRRLLAQVIEALLAENAYLRGEIQRLRDEVNRLKGEQGKPAFKSGKGGSKKGGRKGSDGDTAKGATQPGESTKPSTDISSEKERSSSNPWHKGSKADRVVVHREQRLDQPPPDLPADAVAGGYVPYVVQDIVIAPLNTRFLRASWYSASQRRTYLAPLPPGYEGEFGPGVHTLVPALHFIGNVSQPGIRRFVESAGVFISSGTVSNILVKGAQPFYSEYDSIFRAGLESSPWQCTDHTTSPVNGELHQCQIIGNPCYTTFATTPSKSRLSIVQVLLNRAHSAQDGPSDNEPMPAYLLDKRAYDYLSRLRCPRPIIDALKKLPQEVELCEGEFHLFLAERVAPAIRKRVRHGQAVKQVLSEHRVNQICDAAAIAYYHAQKDWPVVDTLLADDASAFREITNGHSLCWVHEGRLYKKLIPYLQQHREAVDHFLARFWKYYDALLRYRQKPTPGAKRALNAGFDKLFSSVTRYGALDDRIAMTYTKKKSLLLVLEHPELPLHNNDSELAARARVRKRDVSLQTRTSEGTRAWDTFMTLVATARKLGVNSFHYLHDRISHTYAMPSLASLIAQRAAALNLGASWNTS